MQWEVVEKVDASIVVASSHRQRVVKGDVMPSKLRMRTPAKTEALPAASDKTVNLRRLLSNAPQ